MAASKRLRYEVMRRDNHTCRYCGACAPDVKLTIDHVVAVALGGSDDPTNLVTACIDCNAGKSSSSADASVVDDVSADALRWAKAIKDAAEIYIDYDREVRDNVRAAFREAWEGWTYEYNGERKSFELPADWPPTIDNLARSGLRREDLIDCVNECMYRDRVRDRFRYFCGIAWNTVRHLHESAAEVIAVDEAFEECHSQGSRPSDAS